MNDKRDTLIVRRSQCLVKSLYQVMALVLLLGGGACTANHTDVPSGKIRHDIAVSIDFSGSRLRSLAEKQVVVAVPDPAVPSQDKNHVSAIDYVNSFDLYFTRTDGTVKAYLHATPETASTNLFDQGAKIFVDGVEYNKNNYGAEVFRAFLISSVNGRQNFNKPEFSARLKVVGVNPAITRVAILINGQTDNQDYTSVRNVYDLQLYPTSRADEMGYFDYKDLVDAVSSDGNHDGREPIAPSPQKPKDGYAAAVVKAVTFGDYDNGDTHSPFSSYMGRFQVIDQFCIITQKSSMLAYMKSHPTLPYYQAWSKLKEEMEKEGAFVKNFKEFTSKMLDYNIDDVSGTAPLKACVAYVRDSRHKTLLGLKHGGVDYSQDEIDAAYGYPKYFKVELIGDATNVKGVNGDYEVNSTIKKKFVFLNHFYPIAFVKGGVDGGSSNPYNLYFHPNDLVYVKTVTSPFNKGQLPDVWNPIAPDFLGRQYDAKKLNKILNDRLSYRSETGFSLYNPDDIKEASVTYLSQKLQDKLLKCFAFNFFLDLKDYQDYKENYKKIGTGSSSDDVPSSHIPFIHFYFDGLADYLNKLPNYHGKLENEPLKPSLDLQYVNIVGYQFADKYRNGNYGGKIFNINLGDLNQGFGVALYSDDPDVKGYARPDISYSAADLTVTIKAAEWTEVNISNPDPSGFDIQTAP